MGILTEEELFAAAIHKPIAERAAFLDQACGQEATLRAQVEALLAAHDHPDSLLEVPACNATVDTPTQITESPGAQIGPYKLLQLIGEGGMGVVFMAEQAEPVQRRVALKIIKAGMDTRQVIARFEAERQALAMMDHQNIAKVFEAGTTESGRPYFVMELVKGIPINRYCDEKHLSLKERLELMIPVCQAIQHSHQKGIIHRDIKPTNVLIAQYDGRPVPKVIDFGVAKATAQKLTERTIFTELGQVVGTVEYMSPEQAELNQLDIDTRSDIYSLGVLLYELLTASTPFDRQKLRAAAFHEMLRIIREDEPLKPSASISTSGTIASISANRQSDPARLSKAVRGELDWIVMKTLEKDRNRRYETANGLASDIQRYLNDEAVQACPPSARYRFGKFARKNRATLTTVTIVTLALLIGTVVSTWQAVRATNAKTEARAKEVLARKAAESERAAKMAETIQRKRAEASEKQALAAAKAEKKSKEFAEAREAEMGAVIDFVAKKVFAAARPEGQDGGLGREVTLRRAVEAALPYVASGFTDRPIIEARLRTTMGISFLELGDAQIAADQFQRALALHTQYLGGDHPDTLRSMNNLANSYADLGRYADALKLHEETLTLRKAKLGPDHPETLRSMSNLAIRYGELARHADAFKLHKETLTLRKAKLGTDHPDTLASMNNLANSYADLGRYADALKLHEETLTLRKAKLGPDHPDTLASMSNLANSYADLGQHADALKLREETLTLMKAKLGIDHPATLRNMNNLANGYSNLGRHAEALQLNEEALSLQKAKLGPNHPQTLGNMNNLAMSYGVLGRHAEALQLHEETLALMKAKLGPDHPHTLASMLGVAASLSGLDRGAEAVPVIDECVRRAAGQTLFPNLVPDVMELRLRHFQKIGDATGCLETAGKWEELKRADAESLYNSACNRAVCAAVIQDTDKTPAGEAKAKEQADQALAWLKQAVAAGFRDAPHIKKDKDLDALRDREDFEKLVAGLLGT